MAYSPMQLVRDCHDVERDAMRLRISSMYTTDVQKIKIWLDMLNRHAKAIHRCKVLERVAKQYNITWEVLK